MNAAKSYPPILAPSILAGNHARLASSAELIHSVGLKWVHLDIMDGHFVPNLTFGPQAVADLRQDSTLFFDTHLMLDNPQDYIEAFAKAGANLISIHIEPPYPVAATLKKIRDCGCQRGIVLNPGTPAETIRPHLSDVDLVLVMTVQPGFGGQVFQEAMLEKITIIDNWRTAKGYTYRLEVDGGINLENAKLCAARGVDTFVAGTSFFRAEDKRAFAQTIESNSYKTNG